MRKGSLLVHTCLTALPKDMDIYKHEILAQSSPVYVRDL